MSQITTAVFVIRDVDVDYDGDEIDVFHVYCGDDDGEPTGKTYTFRSGGDRAFALGQKMAAERRVEMVVE